MQHGSAPACVVLPGTQNPDASITKSGHRRVVSKRLLCVEIDSTAAARHLNHTPYLDYRPLQAGEPALDTVLSRPECKWIGLELEGKVPGYAIAHVVPEHLVGVRCRVLALLDKTESAVKDRLTKEINCWDFRAEQLKQQERSAKPNARLNCGEARKRADELQARLQRQMEEIQRERQLAPLPPGVLVGVLVVPLGSIRATGGQQQRSVQTAVDTQADAARARGIVVEIERSLGFLPVDLEFETLDYDIESGIPESGRLHFIEVKRRIVGKNEILYSRNQPDDLVLAMVEFSPDESHEVRRLRRHFHEKGVNYLSWRHRHVPLRAIAQRSGSTRPL